MPQEDHVASRFTKYGCSLFGITVFEYYGRLKKFLCNHNSVAKSNATYVCVCTRVHVTSRKCFAFLCSLATAERTLTVLGVQHNTLTYVAISSKWIFGCFND